MSFEDRAQLEEVVAQMTGSAGLSAETHRQLWDQLDSYRIPVGKIEHLKSLSQRPGWSILTSLEASFLIYTPRPID